MGYANEQFWANLASVGIYPDAEYRAPEHEEDRCGRCEEKGECPAAHTGVAYPCPHFREEQT